MPLTLPLSSFSCTRPDLLLHRTEEPDLMHQATAPDQIERRVRPRAPSLVLTPPYNKEILHTTSTSRLGEDGMLAESDYFV